MFRKFLLTGLTLFLISGCGGGSSSYLSGSTGTGGSSSSSGATTSYYLPYLGSVELVDCSSPTSPVKLVEGDVDEAELFSKNSSIDLAGGTYSDYHPTYLVYILNGKVYRLSVIKGSSLPRPEEVSGIDDACSFKEGEHDMDTDRAYLIVETAGADGDCATTGDNGEALVDVQNLKAQNLGSKRFITFLPDGSYRITHALFIDTASLTPEVCELPQLSNCRAIPLPKVVQSSPNYLLTGVSVYRHSKGRFEHFYCLDFGSGGELYGWDGSQMSLLTGGDCSGWTAMSADEERVYGTDGSKIYSYSNSSLNEIVSGVGDIQSIGILGNYLIYLSSSSTLTGGLSFSLGYYDVRDGTLGSIDNGVVPPYLTADKKVFYIKSDGTSSTACYWPASDSSLSPVCFTNSYWAGFTRKPSGTVDSMIKGLLLVKKGSEEDTLYFVEPENLDNESAWRLLGTVDTNVALGFYGVGNCLLGQGVNSQADNEDVYFVDTDRENSLVNITDTPSEDEEVVFME